MPPIYSHRLIEAVTEDPLTVEEYLRSHRAQQLLVEQVVAIADVLANTPEEDDIDAQVLRVDCIIHSPLISVPLFDFVIETNRLPEFASGKRIIYGLVSNKLSVQVMPSLCHHAAAGAITNDLIRWSESGGSLNCLEQVLTGGTTLHCLSLTSLAWLFDNQSKKSPDNSFAPTDLQSPPAKTIGNTNVIYPTFTIEVGKSHESWDQLFRDAESKHFAADTSVAVYLGIIIFATKRMKVCLLQRDSVRGFGYLNPPLAQTGFLDINVPCNITIVVPKHLIFFGVPAAMVPVTVTADYHLNVDIIRQRVLKYWQA
jgi:hypothetical protein